MKPSLEILTKILQSSWSVDTARTPSEWNESNPARGQCVISSLIVQDYFGGELIRYKVTGEGIDETHFCNLLDGDILVDTTVSQYQTVVSQTRKPEKLDGFASTQERLLADEDTLRRYMILKSRVDAQLQAQHT